MTRTPEVASTAAELAARLGPARAAGRGIVLVPTMGALHAGHAALLAEARRAVGDGLVVASIFVNPLQFGAGEDLDRYPRTLPADLEVCAGEGVDVVFAPGVDDVYPGGDPVVTVDPGPLGDVLEGKVRPGHFRGVLTVVAKLFGLVQPTLAVFGEKDYQQLVAIRTMVRDLVLPVRVVGVPTVRDTDGLALSSRNQYLDRDERREATALHRVLAEARAAQEWGPQVALEAARAELRRSHGVDLDYLVITDPDLGEVPDEVVQGTPARILVAARVGTTRLIDNMPLTLGAWSAQGGS